jgi:chromosome partitioning protein
MRLERLSFHEEGGDRSGAAVPLQPEARRRENRRPPQPSAVSARARAMPGIASIAKLANSIRPPGHWSPPNWSGSLLRLPSKWSTGRSAIRKNSPVWSPCGASSCGHPAVRVPADTLRCVSLRSGRSAAIIDVDPQASATGWADHRKSDKPAVVSSQAARLSQVLAAANDAGAALAIIDTAPHSEHAALAAARAADLILIPCRAAILDLRAINSTIDLAKLAGKPAAVVLNSVPPLGSLGQDADDAIEAYNVDVCPIRITQRAVFVHALTVGLAAQEFEPESKGATEIRQLYKWMCKQVGL